MKKLILLSLVMFEVIALQAQSIKIYKLPFANAINSHDTIIVEKGDSSLAKRSNRASVIALSNYLGTSNMPQILFNHWVPAYNTSTSETILWNDSIPAGQITSSGNKIKAFYAGLDSANNADTLFVYLQGTLIQKLGRSIAVNWHVDVIIMTTAVGTVYCSLYTTFNQSTTNPAPEYYKIISGLTLSNKLSLKITGKSAGGSRQIQAQIGTLYYQP